MHEDVYLGDYVPVYENVSGCVDLFESAPRLGPFTFVPVSDWAGPTGFQTL